MKILLLGTGGYFPTSRRHTPCFLLPEVGIALDAGSGMCRLGDHLQTDRLDVFITHAHLDHIAGLTYLINAVPRSVLERTVVHGEASKLAAVRTHLFAEEIFPVAPPFRFEPLDGSTWATPGGGNLRWFELQHPGGSLGYRLDWPGHSLAYVTDTTASTNADYITHIQGVDLLLHEAYFADDAGDLPARTGHSSLLPVAELARAANVRRLVLVHIDPRCTADTQFDLGAARSVFPNLDIGVDGMELDF